MTGGGNGFEDGYWLSADGLRLHYRDYPGDAAAPPAFCLAGLTRNARDFDRLAPRLAGARRVIAVDFRGRAKSAYAADPASYVPATYLADIQGLIDTLGIERGIVIGTSLGGIVAMLLAAARPHFVTGMLLNDVGPELEAVGLARIRGYVGRQSNWPTWMHAARAVQESHGDAHPGFGIEDWLAMAKRLYRLNSSGRIVLDYDMKIAEPLRHAATDPAPDLWGMMDALHGVPTLIVRGGRSDVLSAQTAERMAATLDRAELVTLPDIGHAPTLDEPELQPAIDRLLARAAEPALA